MVENDVHVPQHKQFAHSDRIFHHIIIFGSLSFIHHSPFTIIRRWHIRKLKYLHSIVVVVASLLRQRLASRGHSRVCRYFKEAGLLEKYNWTSKQQQRSREHIHSWCEGERLLPMLLKLSPQEAFQSAFRSLKMFFSSSHCYVWQPLIVCCTM